MPQSNIPSTGDNPDDLFRINIEEIPDHIIPRYEPSDAEMKEMYEKICADGGDDPAITIATKENVLLF